MPTFGERLKHLRLENNLTQEELASKFGLHKTRISQYELNKRQADDDMKKKLAKYFNVSLDYIMGNSDIKNFTSDDELKKLIIQSNINDNDLYKTLLSLKKKLNSNSKMFISGNELPEAHKDMLLSVVNLLLTQNNESK